MSIQLSVLLAAMVFQLHLFPMVSHADGYKAIWEALEHAKEALQHGKQRHADALVNHAEIALKYALIARNKYKVNKEIDSSITELEKAIRYGKQGNLNEATLRMEAVMTLLSETRSP